MACMTQSLSSVAVSKSKELEHPLTRLVMERDVSEVPQLDRRRLAGSLDRDERGVDPVAGASGFEANDEGFHGVRQRRWTSTFDRLGPPSGGHGRTTVPSRGGSRARRH
jgi:hypothetical protein